MNLRSQVARAAERRSAVCGTNSRVCTAFACRDARVYSEAHTRRHWRLIAVQLWFENGHLHLQRHIESLTVANQLIVVGGLLLGGNYSNVRASL